MWKETISSLKGVQHLSFFQTLPASDYFGEDTPPSFFLVVATTSLAIILNRFKIRFPPERVT